MKLSVINRLVLLNVLPKEGNILTLRIVRDLQSALSFSEAELEALKFQELSVGMAWNQKAAETLEAIDIEIGKEAKRVIVVAFKKLNNEQKLTMDMLPTFELFEEKDNV